MSDDPNDDAVARGDIIPEGTPPAEEEQQELELEAPPTEAAVEEPEAEPAPAPVEEEPREHKIPKSRFDEAVQKERQEKAALEAQLQQYQQRDQQLREAENFEASEVKVKELLKQHSSLLADGDLDKASEVMGAVLQLRDDMQNARMEKRAANATNAAKIEVQYDATVAQLEAEYPEINPDSDAFDQTVVGNVQAMVTGIMQNEGLNPADALQKATNILLKPLKEARGKDLRDKPSEEAVEQGMRRVQQQVNKNIAAADKQPPQSAEVGQDHDATGGPMDASAIQKMSWEEFIKVPDEELAKIRGDYLN